MNCNPNINRKIMKGIKAIIQPWMLPKVIEALKALPDLPGVTVSRPLLHFFRRDRATVTAELALSP